MKRNKVRQLALAVALAGTMFSSTADFSMALTANQTMATLSSQVQVSNFAAARETILNLQQLGIAAIVVGTETISLADLLALVDAAAAGQVDPAGLAAYLDALAASTAQAFFVPVDDPSALITTVQGTFPTGSEG